MGFLNTPHYIIYHHHSNTGLPLHPLLHLMKPTERWHARTSFCQMTNAFYFSFKFLRNKPGDLTSLHVLAIRNQALHTEEFPPWNGGTLPAPGRGLG